MVILAGVEMDKTEWCQCKTRLSKLTRLDTDKCFSNTFGAGSLTILVYRLLESFVSI